MSPRRPIPALLIAVASVLALGACGSSGPSDASFKKAFAAEKVKFQAIGVELGNDISHASRSTDAALGAQMSDLSTRTTTEARALAKISTPEKYRADRGAVVDGLTKVAGDMHAVGTAALGHDVNAAKTATESLLLDSMALKKADNTMSSKLGLPVKP